MAEQIVTGMRGLGGILVLFSCAGLGVFYGSEINRRIRELQEMHSQLIVMQGEIRYMRNSLPEVFDSAARRNKSVWQNFFSEVADALRDCRSASFFESYQAALVKTGQYTALKKSDYEMLTEFGRLLGRMDAELQNRAFEWILKQSEDNLARIKEQVGKKTVLYRSLGFLSGIFIVVMML